MSRDTAYDRTAGSFAACGADAGTAAAPAGDAGPEGVPGTMGVPCMAGTEQANVQTATGIEGVAAAGNGPGGAGGSAAGRSPWVLTGSPQTLAPPQKFAKRTSVIPLPPARWRRSLVKVLTV